MTDFIETIIVLALRREAAFTELRKCSAETGRLKIELDAARERRKKPLIAELEAAHSVAREQERKQRGSLIKILLAERTLGARALTDALAVAASKWRALLSTNDTLHVAVPPSGASPGMKLDVSALRELVRDEMFRLGAEPAVNGNADGTPRSLPGAHCSAIHLSRNPEAVVPLAEKLGVANEKIREALAS